MLTKNTHLGLRAFPRLGGRKKPWLEQCGAWRLENAVHHPGVSLKLSTVPSPFSLISLSPESHLRSQNEGWRNGRVAIQQKGQSDYIQTYFPTPIQFYFSRSQDRQGRVGFQSRLSVENIYIYKALACHFDGSFNSHKHPY